MIDRLSRRTTIVMAAFVAIVLLAFALAAVPTPASAAQLTVRTSHPVINTAARCTTATFATTAPVASAASATVRVTVPAGSPCIGLPIAVSVVRTDGGVVSSTTSVTAVAGDNHVTVPSYNTSNVTSVAVFFNTWWINSTWTAPIPPRTSAATCVGLDMSGNPTGQLCTASVTKVNAWGNPGSRLMNAHLTITTDAPNWTVAIDLSFTPTFPGWVPKSVTGNSNPSKVAGYSCSELPVIRGKANTLWAATDRNTLYIEASEVQNAYTGSSSFCS